MCAFHVDSVRPGAGHSSRASACHTRSARGRCSPGGGSNVPGVDPGDGGTPDGQR